MTRTRTPPPPEPSPLSVLERAWPWIIRFVGIGIALFETVLEHADRPSLLALAAGMIGLPSFVKLDRKRNGGG